MGRRHQRVAEEPPLILVDSATWADWLNGNGSDHALRLEQAISSNEALGLAPVILTEVLQGLRSEQAFEDVRKALLGFPLLRLDDAGHVEAARLYRSLKKAGRTIRGTIDV